MCDVRIGVHSYAHARTNVSSVASVCRGRLMHRDMHICHISAARTCRGTFARSLVHMHMRDCMRVRVPSTLIGRFRVFIFDQKIKKMFLCKFRVFYCRREQQENVLCKVIFIPV